MTLARRSALRLLGAATAGAALGGLAACTGSEGTTPKPSRTGAGATRTGGAPTGTSAVEAPSAADWDRLSRAVSGGIHRPGQPGFAAAHRIYDPRWDTIQPAAVAVARTTADVVSCLSFATRFGLVPTPRGGGHSYLGASVRSGGLAIDLREMKSIDYQPSSGLATIGGGAVLSDVYRSLAAHGRSIAGGTCPSVGLAGLMMGGGLGVFDRRHGLTCDAVTSMRVVRPDGGVVTASARRQPDLFWALRGGGGGDLGIVTAVTTGTFATAPLGRWYARWPWAAAADAVLGWQRFIAAAPDRVWANLHLDVLPDGTRSVVVIGIAEAGSERADLAACVAAIGRPPTATSHSVHSHLDTVLSLEGSGVRESFMAGSSIPAQALPVAGVAALIDAVADRRHWHGERHAILDPLGGAVSRVPTASSAFAWRGSPFTIQWYANLAITPNAAQRDRAASWVAHARTALQHWASGAYVNYPSPDVRDISAYHGSAYARLKQVKAATDPHRLFRPPGGLPG